MASEVILLSGKAEWAKVRKPDDAFGGSFFKITVDLDKGSQQVFAASDLQLEPKEIDGSFKVTFRREAEKQWPDGTVEEMGPPALFEADGKTELAKSVLIGNGSEVSIKVEVYDTKRGKGHRLKSVRVDKLVPYTLPEVGPEHKAPPVF